MSFDTNSHARFDDAFANLVAAWLQADDLRHNDAAPISERARATFALSHARNEAREARRAVTC